MPKDATKNVDRYKVRGGTFNEFEFAENQEQFSEQKGKGDGKLIPGTPPETKTRAAKKPARKAASETTKKAATKKAAPKKGAPKKAAVATRGASAKKLAARKAAKKK
jgi:hypothetical protein